jgi:hypothetical protein
MQRCLDVTLITMKNIAAYASRAGAGGRFVIKNDHLAGRVRGEGFSSEVWTLGKDADKTLKGLAR